MGLGGITFGLCLFFWALNKGNVPFSGGLPIILFAGALIVNYPHYAATYHRVYSKSDRIIEHSFETIWVPILLLIGATAAFYAPNIVAGWYCLGYILFAGYHYSGQSYGISMVFSNKAGITIGPIERWVFILPLYLCYLYPLLLGNRIGSEPQNFFSLTLPLLNLPMWPAMACLWIFYASFVIYVAYAIYMAIQRNTPLPFIVHIVMGSQILWFSVGSMVNGFNEFVPFFHCLQYLVITSYIYFKDSKALSTPTGFLKTKTFIGYYIILILFGAILFEVIPRGMGMMGLSTTALAMAIIGSAINMHHFMLDAAIWKLRDPRVSKPLVG